jgi:cyclophilin family peptidyl-prolyl cis-trans isomerase/HEAT repeat protein
LLLAVFAGAQGRGVVPAQQKPSLKRDRTQRLLYPKIIQHEDERNANEELVDMLALPHAGLKHRAILALGRIGYPSGLTALLDKLNTDRASETRALAAFSLGLIGSQYAVPPLLDRLGTENETAEVRAGVAEALGRIASDKVAASALGKYGVDSITRALVHLLPGGNEPVSPDQKLVVSLTLSALIRLKDPSTVAAITRVLNSPDADLRWQAANALARIRDGVSAAVPQLIQLLGDKEPLARASAARALGVSGDARAVAPLIKLLSDEDERVAANSITALGSLRDAGAADPIVALGQKLLQGYRSYDRAAAGVPVQQNLLLLISTSLGNLKDSKGLSFLKTFRLADGKLGASPEVEIAVAKFGEGAFFDVPATVPTPKDDWQAVAAYAQGLGQVGTPRAAAMLMDMLSARPDSRAVPEILKALEAAKIDGLRDILLTQLKAEDVMVRATAAELISRMGDSSGPIIDALQLAYKAARADKMNDARIAIIEAAEVLKHPFSIQALSGPLADSDYVVRRRAAELLRESPLQTSASRLTIGKAETGHDRAYYKRVAQLMLAGQNPVAIIHTRKGDIRIELLAALAPMTVDNFIQLATAGFYNGLTFMRVVPNFVIQGGDPRNDTNGGPGYQIRDEINLHPYGTGAVGMALSGKDTGGSQFFITHSPQPHLDGGYTVFGQVIAGQDVVNRIARGDRIERVEIVGQN